MKTGLSEVYYGVIIIIIVSVIKAGGHYFNSRGHCCKWIPKIAQQGTGSYCAGWKKRELLSSLSIQSKAEPPRPNTAVQSVQIQWIQHYINNVNTWDCGRDANMLSSLVLSVMWAVNWTKLNIKCMECFWLHWVMSLQEMLFLSLWRKTAMLNFHL